MKTDILVTDETESGLDEKFFQAVADTAFTKIDHSFSACEISLLICSDADIKELNAQYRGKDAPTDVLSFPMSENPAEEGGMLGDIVISADTAAKQAQTAGIDFKRETAFLFIHGLLHLMGYDHEESAEDEEEMFTLQEEILSILVEMSKVP